MAIAPHPMKSDNSAPQGDFRFSRTLTEADFKALSRQIAQVRDRQDAAALTGAEPGWAAACSAPAELRPGQALELAPAPALPRGCEPLLPEGLRPVYCNRSVAELVEHALLQAEGGLSHRGALCLKTLPYSGTTQRSLYRVVPQPGRPAPSSCPAVTLGEAAAMGPACNSELGCWLPLGAAAFEALYQRALDYSGDRALYQCQGWLSLPQAPPLRLRILTETASQALMAHHWLDTEGAPSLTPSNALAPDFTLLALPGLKGEPLLESALHSEVFLAIHPQARMILLGGSCHGGDLLRAIALALETLLADRPELLLLPGSFGPVGQAVSALPTGQRDQPTGHALFLGAPGSGKQSLASAAAQPKGGSLAPAQSPLPSPAHNWVIWSPQGVGLPLAGDYLSLGGLAPEAPQAQQLGFGSLLENVRLDEQTSVPRYSDYSWTRNLRGIRRRPVPGPQERANDRVNHRGNRRLSGQIGPGQRGQVLAAPRAMFLLIADVAGVLPPLAKLSLDQGLYYLLSGYGSVLPDWERQRPFPTACFSHGWPTQQAAERAILQLRQRLIQSATPIYLLNTGWLGPAPCPSYRRPDNRIPMAQSQGLVQLALAQPELFAAGPREAIFDFALPRQLPPELPAYLSDPARAWESQAAWQQAAQALAEAFRRHWQRSASSALPAGLHRAGPRAA
jgi:phosphoenolpyruvate carboxykinase (ATP)